MRSPWPKVQAVSAPTSEAEVLFDFNDEGVWATDQVGAGAHADGFTIGSPARLSDPGDPRTAWGYRRASFAITIRGNRAEALAAQSRLARWLLRPEGWVRVLLDATSVPVYLRMVGAEPSDLIWDNVYVDGVRVNDRWVVGVSFDAEPFLYGERVTYGPVTVSNDPADGMTLTLPEVAGDAPARLRIRAEPSGDGAAGGAQWMLTSLPGLAAENVTHVPVGTGDGFTSGTDCTTAASASASGGSWRTVSFATEAGMVTRFSGEIGSRPHPGTYRVLVRASRSDTATTFAVRVGQSGLATFFDNDPAIMDRAASSAAGHATWLDCGLMTFPRNLADMPVEEFPFFDGPLMGEPNLDVQVERLSGAGSVRIDSITLVPTALLGEAVDVHSLLSWFPNYGIDTAGVWDGDHEAFWASNSIGTIHEAHPQMIGGWPEAVPGEPNVLHVVQQANGQEGLFGFDTSDSITDTCDVTVSHHPRWLYLGSE